VTNPKPVIPAKAGIQLTVVHGRKVGWTPAFAGVTWEFEV
jgi:hypothetical protein